MADKDKDPDGKANGTATLGPYQVPQETMGRLARLQQAVRDANHAPPSKGLLISALLHLAPDDGESLETQVLGPYRRDHPNEDTPR